MPMMASTTIRGFETARNSWCSLRGAANPHPNREYLRPASEPSG
jgi:hypothetical protein